MTVLNFQMQMKQVTLECLLSFRCWYWVSKFTVWLERQIIKSKVGKWG